MLLQTLWLHKIMNKLEEREKIIGKNTHECESNPAS